MIQYVVEAFASLFANRLRTVLALLGLSVGVAAVIAIQILGHATSGAFAGIFKGLSNASFIVFPNSQDGVDFKAGFTIKQLNDEAAATPHVIAAIPSAGRSFESELGHTKAQLTLSAAGSNPGFYAQTFAYGRAISDEEVSARSRVCVVSGQAFETISPQGNDIVGKSLRVGPIRCSVVGVLKKPPSGALNLDFSPDVVVPYTLYESTFLSPSAKFLSAQFIVDDTATLKQTEEHVLEDLKRLSNGKNTYQALDNTLFTRIFDSIFFILTVIIGFVGGISLVVAGIGIMNILLVSIAERTREIGIRKAIGGTRFQIMLQFFMEAAALTFGGCIIGAAMGVALGAWINSAYIIKISGVIVPLQWQASVLLAIVFAVIVTLAFGTYPAFRAARLDPIEALRYE